MSSDIWHHHQQQQQQQPNSGLFGANFGISGGAKRSRSVLAMPNRSSVVELSRDNQVKARDRNNRAAAVSAARRPTYSGPTTTSATATPTKQIEDNPMSQPELSMGCCKDALIDQQVIGGGGAKHAGPMGIFFKVWSLVKVTRGRHQQRQQQRYLQQQQQQNGSLAAAHRLRRQNSEDNSNYSADFGAPAGGRLANAAAILRDQHFRRAGSQPAPAASVLDRLQVLAGLSPPAHSSATTTTTTTAAAAATTATTTGSSSGVSSAASSTVRVAAAGGASSPGASSSNSSPFRRRHFGGSMGAKNGQHQAGAATKEEQESWVSRLKRNAAGAGSARARAAAAAAANSRRRNSGLQQQRAAHLLSLSLSTSEGSRSSSELRDEPEEDYDDDDEQLDEEEFEHRDVDDDEDDIYSTPNDSIQSVPSGQRALPSSFSFSAGQDQHQPATACRPQVQPMAAAAGEAFPIIKSFSTNNFQKLAAEQQQQPAQTQDNSSDNKQQAPRPALSGSRIFISSSSSEDSQPTKPNAQQQQQQPNVDEPQPDQQQQRRRLQQPIRSRVSVNQGVHSHAVRPQSLLLTGGGGQDQFLVPVQLLTPLTSAGTVLANRASTNVYLAPTAAAHHNHLRSPPSVITGYHRSPSLFEFSPSQNSRFSSRYPPQVSSFQLQQQQQQRQELRNPPLAPSGGQNSNQSRQSIDSNCATAKATEAPLTKQQQHRLSINSSMMPNSISMYDFKQQPHSNSNGGGGGASQTDNCCSTVGPLNAAEQSNRGADRAIREREASEYKLAEMMLESGSNPNARDSQGNTTLMLAVLSDNLSAVKCLIEHGANLNEINQQSGLGPLDLVCARQASKTRVDVLKILIDNGIDLDRQRRPDGSRLLDRLIGEHPSPSDRMPFIECLLEGGAKLSSSTWSAARGKLEVQLCLLRKLCQDGYFLYKKSSIEAAVYRFEYALRRIAELEQQLASTLSSVGHHNHHQRRQSALLMTLRAPSSVLPEQASVASRKIKYQTYLGLSRCERRRKFYKRALEFAQLAILVDSSSYEAFYSKANILKDLGDIDDSLLTIDQTARLIEKTIENSNIELKFTDQQEESLIMDNTFWSDLDRESCRNQSALLAKNRAELRGNLDYLLEARKYVAKLRQDILDDKFELSQQLSGQRSVTNDTDQDGNNDESRAIESSA